MLSSLLLFAMSAQQAPAPVAPPMDVFAMTRSGVQIEVAERPTKGALELTTPFGRYYTPTDPVEVVFERPRARQWANALRTIPDASLLPSIETLNDNGQITALIELGEAVLQRGRPDEVRAALTALEAWGARFDPVPKGKSVDERIEWLWEQLDGELELRHVLLAARLASEVTYGGNGEGDRQIGLVDLRRAIEDGKPLKRRAGLLVARAQLMDEPYFGALVQALSLAGHVVYRDLAGATAVTLRPVAARDYWVRALLRAEEPIRLVAAEQLATHLPDYAPKPFALLLAAGDRLAPSYYELLEHKAQVVVDRNDPLDLRQLELAFSRGGFERGEYLENASTIKVVRLEEGLRRKLTQLLGLLSDDDIDRSAAEWVTWYKNRQVSP